MSLQEFVRDATKEQIRAWDESIPLLQREAGEVIDADPLAGQFSAILEYQLPLESRRPDFVVLLLGPVVVVELKGKESPSQADVDQVAAYARDLRSYHRECADREVQAILVPTRAASAPEFRDGVHIVGPAGLDALLGKLASDKRSPDLTAQAFLREDAYRPLPTLVQAARELMESRTIRNVWRAGADTDAAVQEISEIIHSAASTKSRHLVLLTGVPGSGKTLVGMRIAHANFLDDLAVERRGEKPTAPAVFLSGNGPLVKVLQYLHKRSGGDGKTFVRGLWDYLNSYALQKSKIPPEQVVVFDEAQRAFDPSMVAHKHKKWPAGEARSEPEHMIEIAGRIPEWSVVLGLIGTGQEIYVGEEAGLAQWKSAIESSAEPRRWTVHAPALVEEAFVGSSISTRWVPTLNLNTQMRFHMATVLHEWVTSILERQDVSASRKLAERLQNEGYRLLITRSLAAAKQYPRDRYEENADACFGLVASSKDKDLKNFGVENNTYMSPVKNHVGEWYSSVGEWSCRRLESVMVEFDVQGLELDFSILCWGSDFRRSSGKWTSEDAGKFQRPVSDPHRLRKNVYRVLLTRGRDGSVIFMPALGKLDETWSHLLECGVRELK